MSELCVCGSGKAFASCCERFLSGAESARTAEQLMRSRYTAYALGGHGEYLLQTWYPVTAPDVTAEELSLNHQAWEKLEVLAKSQSGDEGMVEFNAWYRGEDDALQLMHEKSQFRRINSRWLYLGGEVQTSSGTTS